MYQKNNFCLQQPSLICYLSLDAFNSKTASLKEVPSKALARHKILVVLPVPGGPYNPHEDFKHDPYNRAENCAKNTNKYMYSTTYCNDNIRNISFFSKDF